MSDFRKSYTVAKVDDSLGLVMGWAVVCTENGQPYYDLTKTYDEAGAEVTAGDHIPEEAMLEMASEFMADSRVAKEMHQGDAKGTVVHSFPLTKDIADAFGILTDRTGWMVAVKFDDQNVMAKFKDGTYTGFSIGGSLSDWDEVEIG
jgi:hypothetical protein